MIENARANADILAGYQWLATLDSHTCLKCAIRDGLRYTLEFEPIGHSLAWGRGPGKIHRNCRCTFTFVLKSAEQMRLNGLKPGMRASMNGQVPADTTYTEWLKGQPASVQDDVLGVIRGRLYRKGQLPIDRFVDNRGQLINLQALREQDSEAFVLAGL